LKKSTARKGIYFIILSIVTSGLVLKFTVTEETIEAVKLINYNYLIIIAGIWLTGLTMDALTLYFLTKGANERISLITAYKVYFIRIFFGLITPFTVGGQPSMIYYMSRNNVPPGKSSSVVLIRFMIVGTYGLFGAITAFILFYRKLTSIPALNIVFLIAGVLQLVLITLIGLSILYPQILIKFAIKIGDFLKKIKILKNTYNFRKKIIHEAALARSSFKRYFKNHRWYLIMAIIGSGARYLSEASLFWIILRMLNIDICYLDGIMLSVLMFFVLSFLPTPGGSGIGEVIFVLILSGTIPKHLLGISMILWRFFYQYISAMIGAFISADHFSPGFKIEKD